MLAAAFSNAGFVERCNAGFVERCIENFVLLIVVNITRRAPSPGGNPAPLASWLRTAGRDQRLVAASSKKHSRRVEEHRDDKHEPSQGRLAVGADKRRQIRTGPRSTFGSASAFASTVSLSARLLRLAVGRPRSSLEIGDAQGDGTELSNDGGHGVKKLHEPYAPTLAEGARNVSSYRRTNRGATMQPPT
jgi:hypothetical protein